jgi:hypothetical protein
MAHSLARFRAESNRENALFQKLENETIDVSKHWKSSGDFFQALEKFRWFFPSLGKQRGGMLKTARA